MNKTMTMDQRSERMLELLSEGASARIIAKKLGYSEGTMRVYLHNLYRAIGVRNKTEAVIWHMHRERRPAPEMPPPQPSQRVPSAALVAGWSFGDMALAEDLYTAMGIMASFVGPYGQLWEAGLKLKGTPIDEKLVAQRAQSRLLWRALLKGEFGYAKMLYDEGIAEQLATESTHDSVLIACLLSLGGYTAAASRLASQLGDRRKGNAAVAGREMALMRAVAEAMEGRGESSAAALHALASEKGRAPALTQVAIASLFHVYRARKLLDGARQTADALWAEAETARQQLEAMGLRPLAREVALPPLGQGRQGVASMRKAVVLR